MGPPPRVPLVLLLLLAAERTARGTFPEEPGPIAVAPPDCECPAGAVPGRGARLGRERDGFGMNTGRDHPGWGWALGHFGGHPWEGFWGALGLKQAGAPLGGILGWRRREVPPWARLGVGVTWAVCGCPVTPL